MLMDVIAWYVELYCCTNLSSGSSISEIALIASRRGKSVLRALSASLIVLSLWRI